MNRAKIVFFFISLIFIFSCSLALAEESISITTYYPSPYGVYNEMRLFPHSTPMASCDSTTEGTMFYNLTAHELQVCNGLGVWKSGGGFWAGSGNDIYNTNTGNVNIGDNVVGATLHVFGDDPAGGNPLGINKWFFAQGTGESEDSGKFWLQYGQPSAPLLVMSDQDDPSRIQFQQTGAGTANAPQYSSWIGMSQPLSNNISIMGGNVGIGTTTPAGRLTINGDPSSGNNAGILQIFDYTPGMGDISMSGGADSLFAFNNYGDAVNGATYFRSASSGVDSILYLKNNGNVGIGTMNPGEKLHIAGNEEVNIFTESVTNDQFSNPGLLGMRARGVSLSAPQVVQNNDNLWEVIGYGYDGNSYEQSSRMLFNVDGVPSDGIVPGRIEFSTMSTLGVRATHMVIKNDGNIGIGDSTPDEKLTVNGIIKATSFIPPSDIRLKENIQPVGNALDKIMKLNGVTFTWKENNEKGMGVIAQDVEKVFPEIVRTGKESGMKGVNYDSLIAPLIESTKELKAENDALKLRIEALENKLNQ